MIYQLAYIHASIHLSNSLIVNWKSLNFYTITCKLLHYLKIEEKVNHFFFMDVYIYVIKVPVLDQMNVHLHGILRNS